jgi:hypothetical protein
MIMSVNQVANSFNGLAIAFEHNADANNTQTETEVPVVVFSRAFHSPHSTPTGLCPDDMSLITRQVVSKCACDANWQRWLLTSLLIINCTKQYLLQI